VRFALGGDLALGERLAGSWGHSAASRRRREAR
jgi:hypothetical protein